MSRLRYECEAFMSQLLVLIDQPSTREARANAASL